MIGEHSLIESEPNFNERKHCANGRKHNMNEQPKPVGIVVCLPTPGWKWFARFLSPTVTTYKT
jgi:hypothetical protein